MEEFNLENITITFQLQWVTYTWIRVSPFFWLIIPSFYSRGRGNGKKGLIEIRALKIDEPLAIRVYNVHSKKQFLFSFRWLCFEVQFPWYRLTEVGKIYPKRYNWNNQ